MVVDPAPAPMPLQARVGASSGRGMSVLAKGRVGKATAGDDTDRPLVDVGDAQEQG